MIQVIKVTAKTPLGDTQEYMFMGDISKKEEEHRLLGFMLKCCDDCSDKFSCPEDWDCDKWRSTTCAQYEIIDVLDMPF